MAQDHVPSRIIAGPGHLPCLLDQRDCDPEQLDRPEGCELFLAWQADVSEHMADGDSCNEPVPRERASTQDFFPHLLCPPHDLECQDLATNSSQGGLLSFFLVEELAWRGRSLVS